MSSNTETVNLQLLNSVQRSSTTNGTDESGAQREDGVEESLSPEDADDYDPHLHRDRPFPTTNAETLIHLLKGSLGTGILAMPNAFYNSGYVTGVIATVIIGALATYCLHVLVRSQYILCKKLKVPLLSYPMTMKFGLEQGPSAVRWFAPYAPMVVDGFLIVYQLGICCVYIVFVSLNIKEVTDHYWEPLDIKTHMFILLIPLILMSYIKNLKRLAPFSTVANFITFAGLAMVMVYMFDDLPALSEREPFGKLRNFPLYFGTTLFALEAVGVIIALENNMKTPKSFGGYFGVLNFGMTVIVGLYIFMGFFGYIKYGEHTKGSVTFNLPKEQVLAQCVKIMFAIAIFISYALQGYVPVDIIWNTYLSRRIENRKFLWEYVLRTAITLVTFTLAITIPRLALFISLFGALCLSALGIAFPAIIEICALWPNFDMGRFNYVLVKNIFLIVFGLLGLLAGTFVSIIDIVNSFKDA